MDELQDLEREWVEQDQSRAEALREAHRKAGTKAVKNDRTPEPERRERRAAMLDSIRAGAEVVIEFGRETVAWIGRNEDDLLAELRGEPLREVEGKHEEAQRLVREARAHAWILDRSARFVIGAADNVMQPLAPSLAELEGGGPSPQWTFDPKVLRRPWFQLQEWNSATPVQEPVRR